MSLPYFTTFVVLVPMLTKTMSNFQITRTLLANLKLPDTVLSVHDLVQARISISEYICLSVYEMASKFSARCARRLFLKKNIVKQGQNNWRIQFFTGYDYLWTRKPNTRIYTNKRISLPRDPKT